MRKSLLSAALLASIAGSAFAQDHAAWQAKVDPLVLSQAAAGVADFLVVLEEQADLRDVARLPTKLDKGRAAFRRLVATAQRTQGPLLAELSSKAIEVQPFWVVNMIRVRGNLAAVEAAASRPEVAEIVANPTVRFEGPVESGPEDDGHEPAAIEWGVNRVGAPALWAQGFTGQGIVIGGQDTGYRWDHNALKGKYRGWNGTTADHNYNWHDAIHSGGGSCGPNTVAPCDDQGHGTHTMGTMVGDDGAGNQVGVAPGAKWIGCRNMNVGAGTPATYAECFQFFLAPTNLAGGSPDPSKAPDVINNSWGCPPSEGCTDPNVLKMAVENLRSAGVVVVVSAGNSGAACSTVQDPPAIYQASFSVGASDINDVIAGFSSRGPVTIDGSNRLKPNVAAPGVSIRSSTRTSVSSYGNNSGTSMAGPHVAGLVALEMSAAPWLRGEPDRVEAQIQRYAQPFTGSTCGGTPGTARPNNTWGFGRVRSFVPHATSTIDFNADGESEAVIYRNGTWIAFPVP